MSKKTRIIAIFIVCVIASLVLQSCCGGYKYRWEYIITETLNDNEITEVDSIQAENFGIRLNLISQKFATNTFNPFVENLYAYDCWPVYTLLDTIIDIQVTTFYDFNEEFSSGSDLTELFTGSSNGNSIHPVSELISRINGTEMNSTEYIDLFLNHDMIIGSNQKFLVTIELSDKRILEGEVKELWLY